jgi:hypothetical protein
MLQKVKVAEIVILSLAKRICIFSTLIVSAGAAWRLRVRHATNSKLAKGHFTTLEIPE